MTVSYELTKQLKDAGFYQPTEYRESESSEYAYTPSLSELIAACPLNFNAKYFTMRRTIAGWYAGYFNVGDEYGDVTHGLGATPEEAVARLWLKLVEGESQ